MTVHSRLLAVVFGIAVWVSSCGCAPTSGKSWGIVTDSVTTTIDDVTMLNCTLGRLTRDGNVYFVVAANGCTGFNHSGGGGTFRGELRSANGGKIEWSCTTVDGQGGKVAINGQTFDLTGGGLFLVSTKDKPVQVEQLAVAAEQLQTCVDSKSFFELAKADSRIATFFQSCIVDE